MVSIKDIRASNASFQASKESLTAVFVGGTSGIGMGTLKQFAKHAHAPKVYIVGRSRSSAQPLLDDLTSSNPQGSFVFLETQITLMKNVDQVCEEIKAQAQKVDLLFMTPGYLSFEGRNETSEGIDLSQALRYYARLRFVYNLLPLLNRSSAARVVGILAGGKEVDLDFNDLEMKKKFNSFQAAANGATQTTLAFEELAKSNPGITFIHKYPGFVATGVLDHLMTTATGLYAIPATIARYVLVPFLSLFGTSPEVAGERGVFVSTSARYPPAQPKTKDVGVVLPAGIEVAKASVIVDGKGNGVYLLDESDESSSGGSVMPRLREEGKTKVVLESTIGVWERALERA